MKKLLLMLIAALSIMLTSCEPREEIKTGRITVTNNCNYENFVSIYPKEYEDVNGKEVAECWLSQYGSISKTLPVGEYAVYAMGGWAVLKRYYVTIDAGDEINVSIR